MAAGRSPLGSPHPRVEAGAVFAISGGTRRGRSRPRQVPPVGIGPRCSGRAAAGAGRGATIDVASPRASSASGMRTYNNILKHNLRVTLSSWGVSGRIGCAPLVYVTSSPHTAAGLSPARGQVTSDKNLVCFLSGNPRFQGLRATAWEYRLPLAQAWQWHVMKQARRGPQWAMRPELLQQATQSPFWA